MSDPAVIEPPAPAPAPTPTNEELDRIEPIRFEEIHGQPQNTPAAVPPPAPGVVQPPVPPTPAAAPAKPDPLAGLFGAPAETPPGETPPETPPEPGDDKAPAWYREAISTQKKQFELQLQEREQQALADRKAREEAEARLNEWQREQSLVNPMLSPEVAQATANLDRAVKDTARLLKPESARKFAQNGKPLIEEFLNLGDIYDAGYDEKYNALREKVKTAYGFDSDTVFNSLPTLSQQAVALKEQIERVSTNGDEVIHQRAEKAHMDALRRFEEVFDTSLSFDDELAASSPFATRNVLSRLLEGSPEFKEHSGRLKAYLKQAMLPPKPLAKGSLAGMTQEEAHAAQVRHMQHYQESFKGLWEMIPVAFHAYAALPEIANMLATTKTELNKLKGFAPPSTTGGAPDDPTPPPAPELPPGGFKPIGRDEIYR